MTRPRAIGVAVSGGGDSMALLHLVARAGTGAVLRAVTVDHGLRTEAAAEAGFVAGFCRRIGVAHDILSWEHGPVDGNLPDQARRARYRLIGDWARGRGIGHVVVGHTADDRAETLLMELARQAGLDGLTAMRPAWEAGGIRFSRPLLTASRESLRAYLRAEGVGWIDDPTNEDGSYQRVRARRALKALAPLGIGAEGLARVAANLALARADLEALAARTAAEIARTPGGAVILDRALWLGTGKETGRRILIAALRWLSSAPYAPRAAQVARLETAIRQGRDATLRGCRVRTAATEIRLTREPKAVAALETPTDALWDGRWRMTGPHENGLRTRALGAGGLRQCPDWRRTGLSSAALVVSPAVWRDQALVAAPLAGYGTGWTAEIVAPLNSFLLSH
ncbi:tRNA lysidine(34) synthetase TilS [Albidovulum sp.]|uniref:tRNA lysidine(34) synthetase TilS n=1 Tax=Albidovulum sp. TaxID=1872424 RepID=UPI0035277709